MTIGAIILLWFSAGLLGVGLCWFIDAERPTLKSVGGQTVLGPLWLGIVLWAIVKEH